MNWFLLKNSFLVSGLTTVVAVSLGFVTALSAAGLPRRCRTWFFALAITALALPPFLVVNCWIHLLGPVGVWRSALPLNILSLPGTVLVLSLLLWPIPLLAVWSAWQRLEPAQLEIEPVLTGWPLIKFLLFPLARTALVQAAVLVFVLALNNFAVPAILQVQVFPVEAWIRFNTAFDTAGALRLSLPLMLAPLLALIWFSRRGFPWPHVSGAVSAALFRRQLGTPWFSVATVFALLLCVLSAAVPLAQILSLRRTWTELGGALAAGQTAVWNSFWFALLGATLVVVLSLIGRASPKPRGCIYDLRQVNAPRDNLPDRGCVRSTSRSTLASSTHDGGTPGRCGWVFDHSRVPLVIRRLAGCKPAIQSQSWSGLCAQAANLRYPPNARFSSAFNGPKFFSDFLSWALWLPFLLPGVLLGIGLIHLLNHPWSGWFYQSAGIVILAFLIRYLALGWNTVAHSVQATDPNLIDVARLEGANRWQMFRHVLWPQIRPQVAIAWYVVFLLCLWDVESMILVMPPGGETLAVRVFNLLHYGYNPQVNALCLTLLGVALLPLLAYQSWDGLLRRLWQRRREFAKPGLLLALVSLLPLAACSRSNASNAAALHSRIFSRVEIIGSRGVGVGQLNKPRSVAVDAQDNVYAVDMTGRVQEFAPNGNFVLLWQMPQTQLGKPKGMCRDRNGNIIVVEPHYSRVNHFSTNGHLVAQWGVRGTNSGQLTVPRAVAVNSRGEIFVSEYLEAERVQKFILTEALQNAPTLRAPASDTDSLSSSSASDSPLLPDAPPLDAPRSTPFPSSVQTSVRFLGSFGTSGTGPGEFNRPEGLCVDAQDRVYVADSCNHRIQVFSSEGKLLRVYGKPGKGLGELSYPYDICVDAAGMQYVCEFGNSRIQVFDAQDRPVEIIGGPGSEPGQFSNPWGVALDSAGNLYVADSQNHRIQKLIRNHALASSTFSSSRRESAQILDCFFVRSDMNHGGDAFDESALPGGAASPRQPGLKCSRRDQSGLTSAATARLFRTSPFEVRASDLGLLSAFDLRTPDFPSATVDCGLWTVDNRNR